MRHVIFMLFSPNEQRGEERGALPDFFFYYFFTCSAGLVSCRGPGSTLDQDRSHRLLACLTESIVCLREKLRKTVSKSV